MKTISKNEDNLKNKDDLKNEDNCKNENNCKNEDNNQNEDDLKNEDNPKNCGHHYLTNFAAHSDTAFLNRFPKCSLIS